MIREHYDDEFRVTFYSYDYEYTLPLCLQLVLCPRGAAHTTYGVEPGADMSCCAHLFINLGCCCVQMSGGHWTSRMRRWICLWEWRYEASAHSATQNVIKTEAAYKEMPLDDLWGSLLCLERMEPTARRALGGAHPETAAFEKSLQNVRAALRARETPDAPGILEQLMALFKENHGRDPTEAEVQQWRDTLREAAEEADAGVVAAAPKEDNTPRGKAPEPVAQVSVEPAAKKQRVAEA